MIFTAKNTIRATVYDVVANQRIEKVISIDTDAMELVCCEFPLRVSGDTVATYTIKYKVIYPLYAGDNLPCLFHCYWRVE